MQVVDFFTKTVAEISQAISPLSSLDDKDKIRFFLRDLGYDAPNINITLNLTVFSELPPKIEVLLDAILKEEYEKIPEIVKDIIALVTKAFEQIKTISDDLGKFYHAVPDFLIKSHIESDLPRRVVDYLVVSHLSLRQANLSKLLVALGLINKLKQVANADTYKSETVIQVFNWEKIPQIFSDPAKILKETYNWGNQQDFIKDFVEKKYEELLQNLVDLFNGLHLPAGIYPELGDDNSIYKEARIPLFITGEWPTTYGEFGITFRINKNTAVPPLPIGLEIQAYTIGHANVNQEITFAIGNNWQLILKFSAAAALKEEILLILNPQEGIKFEIKNAVGNSGASGSIDVSLNRNDPAIEKFIFGSPGFSRLSYKQIAIQAKLSSELPDNWDVRVLFLVKGGKFVLTTKGMDGFLAKLLEGEIKVDFDITLGWSSKNGVFFEGSGGLEINLSKNINLGVLELLDSVLKISPQGGEKAGIANTFGTTLKGNLGPLKAVIEDLGLKFNLGFPPDMKGNLGLIDLDLGLKPPKGVGLSIDAHAFRGGGYLFIDVEKGEYAGGLEIEVFKLFSLKAIGIITTKLPDGSPGFSLLILITAEFTAVQLGFGFTLTGVGGLLGLNRTSNQEEIGRRIRERTASEIFFPQNVVANIKPIISGLKAVFPEHQGNFVFGPMGKIGWGTPTIVEAELGLIIDVPDPVRIAIIGVARVDLPNKDVNPVPVQLRMAFSIGVDFGKKMFGIDASLYDSRIIMFTISGDFALRIAWGSKPMFIFSVGGFHPNYREAPAELQSMKRLTIRTIDLPFLKIGYEFYLAITSNTAQFGVHAYFFASVGIIEASAFLKFDVLFQFRPFYFIARIECGAALIVDLGFWGRHELFKIYIIGELAGPQPWHFLGHAAFKILWFDVTFDLEKTWGDDAPTIAPLYENPGARLAEELGRPLNWRGIPAPESVQGITIREISEAEGLFLFPSTTLRVSQKIVPIELTLEKFGEAEIEGAKRFEITRFAIDGGTTNIGSPVYEQFAPANFINLMDDEKIARKSYEDMKGGTEIQINESGNEKIGIEVRVNIKYELNYVTNKEKVIFKDTKGEPKQLTEDLESADFLRESRGSAAFRTPFSRETTRPSHLAPPLLSRKSANYRIESDDGIFIKLPLKYGALHLIFSADAPGDVIISILNLSSGIEIDNASLHYEIGNNDLKITLNNIQNGTYFLKFSNVQILEKPLKINSDINQNLELRFGSQVEAFQFLVEQAQVNAARQLQITTIYE